MHRPIAGASTGPDKTRTISIRSVDDLIHVAAARNEPTPVEVRLEMPAIEEKYRRDLERRLNRTLGACGCDEGAALALLYLLALPLLFYSQLLRPSSILDWGAVVVGFVVTLLIGKLLGAATARVRLLRLIKEIRRTLLSPQSTGGT